LIDEVDIITGVSGGSFTALAYALHGERLFSEYEQRVPEARRPGHLIKRVLNPFNCVEVTSAAAPGRSELAAEYYDEILFEGATLRRPARRSRAGRDRARDRHLDRLAARVLPERLRPVVFGPHQGPPVARGGNLVAVPSCYHR